MTRSAARSSHEGLPVEGAGEVDLLGAHEGGGIGHAPGAGVEHRHLGQDGVARPDGHPGHGRPGQGVQVGRAVGVEGALGPPGGPRGVAEAEWGVLGQLGLGIGGGFVGQQRFVGEDARERGLGHGVVEDDDVAEPRELVGHRCEEGQEVRVDQDRPIVGVPDDVGQLVGGEAGVQGVQDPATARDGQVRLEVPGAVPGQGGDPLAAADAQPVERPHQLLAPRPDVGVGRAVDPAVGGPRHHLGVGGVAGDVAQHEPRRERDLHHGRVSRRTGGARRARTGVVCTAVGTPVAASKR